MNVKAEYKIIADHLRCACFLIADGILPSNEGRGYVLRRIMRRAMRQIHKLGAKDVVMYKLVPALIKEMGGAYKELITAQDLIVETLKIEEEKFRTTLDHGLKMLAEELTKNPENKEFSGAIAFKLYDTYGFPLDLTKDILKEHGKIVDIKEFNLEMEKQRKQAKENWVGSGEEKEDEIYLNLKKKYKETKFVGYDTAMQKAKILSIIKNNQEVLEVSSEDKNISIILDLTPFYGTSGGQRGDDGNIILASEIKENELIDYNLLKNLAEVAETKKVAGDLLVHVIQSLKGSFKVGDEVMAIVNNCNRQFRAQNHSATHLLHRALKEKFGNQVTQKGSNVESAYFTFDFNFNRSLTEEELDNIEDLVNFYIRQNSEVKTVLMSLEEAKNSGAMALFGEKYSNQVRVLTMGKTNSHQDWSVELCGGTHVKNTGNIGIFKIISEKGIASGIRRIEGRTGYFAFEFLRLQFKKLQALLESLKVNEAVNEIKSLENKFDNPKKAFNDICYFTYQISLETRSPAEILYLKDLIAKTAIFGEEKQNEIKQKNQEIAKLKRQILSAKLDNLNAEKITNQAGLELTLINFNFSDLDAKELREITLEIKSKSQYQQHHIFAIFASKEDKVAVCLALSNDLLEKYDASKLITLVIEKIGGKSGGGKKDFAMGGGSNASGIKNAIDILKNHLL
jgi:alanyl-tRNA synthetase